MILKKEMDTMSAVLQHLKFRGQDNEFFIHTKGVLSLKGKHYNQNEIKIIRTYRFEGETDPADQAIIYLIRASDGIMGYCIDAYGLYSSHTNDLYSDFIQQAEIVTSHLSQMN
jgi:hypothetical protein